MSSRRPGSSPCIEFFISLLVGLMAIVGGLFIIGFLLVEPLRHPPGQTAAPIISLDEQSCAPIFRSHDLPAGCTANGQSQVDQAVCSDHECVCDSEQDAGICCCRAMEQEPFPDIVCPEGVALPTLTNTTQCGCGACDDLSVQVHLSVVNRETNEPIPAALVLRVEGSPDSISFLGLTNNHGLVMFTDRVGRRYVEIKVVASGYVPYMTVPMRIHPHKKVMKLNIVLIPSMNVEVGMGGSRLVLRLGSMASVSAPADSFYTLEKERVEDMIRFNGVFLTPNDPHGLAGVPGSDFNVLNEQTGDLEMMGVLSVMRLVFLSELGGELTAENLLLQISLADNDGNAPDYCLLLYNETTRRWEKHSNFTRSTESRGKRQLIPLVLENQNTPLNVFIAIASANQVNCWLQGRTFAADGTPVSGDVVSVEYTVPRSGDTLMLRFGTNTGAFSDSELTSNAICLPVDCGPFTEAIVESREDFDAGSSPLIPIPFPDTTFNITESAPVTFGTIFSYDDVITATSSRPRPFYASNAECLDTGIDPNASPDSYFRFDEGAIVTPEQFTDSCSIKIQILDCFANNSVSITSIHPVTGNIEGSTTVLVMEPDEDMTEMPTDSSGTMPTELVTTSSSTGCDASTATLRAACVPYVCGDIVQLQVRPNIDSGRTALCEITGRSVLLSNSLLSDLNNDVQLIARANDLVANDFNDPNLGLYYTAGNNPTAVLMTEELCNAGTGTSTSSMIDVMTGVAAEFTCF